MRKLVLGTMIVLVMSFIAGCSDSKDEDSYQFPLKVGNTWTLLETFDAYYSQTDETITKIDTIYVEIAEKIESPSGEPCYRVEYWSTGDPAHAICYNIVVDRKDGLYLLGWKLGYAIGPFKGYNRPFQGSLFSPEIRDGSPRYEEVWLTTPKKLLPHKCKEGTYWTYGPNANHLEAGYWIMPQESVTVPNGTYNCHVRKTNILEDEEPSDIFNYYSEVGFVKFYHEATGEIVDQYGNPAGEIHAIQKRELISCYLN